MDRIFSPPKEGELYKVVEVGGHKFELRFGYYAEFERERGEPVVVYPDLTEYKLYTEAGQMLVTAIQDPCPYYKVPEEKARDECCCDCEFYQFSGDDIGICSCSANDKEYHGREPTDNRKAM